MYAALLPGPSRSAGTAAAVRTGRTRQVPRILVVDDEPDVLVSVSMVLEELLGFPVEVATARSGDEARDRMAAGERFDLVLTDERMPGLRGADLLEWVRREQPGTARLLMSAYVGAYGEALADRVGAAGFLRKPLDLATALPAVREALGHGDEA